MSHNFNDKDYGDYFKALEQRITNTGEAKKPSSELNTPIKKTTTRAPKKRRYLNFKRAAVLAAVLLIGAIVVGISVSPKKSDTEKKQAGDTLSGIMGTAEEKQELISYEFKDTSAEIPEGNDAEAVIIVNTKTHEVIAHRNAKKQMYPASITKIMTLLVACENIENFDDTFTMTLDITDPLYVEEASVAGFLKDEVITMTDMLYGLILPSGADAAIGLANSVAGNEVKFAELMNKKAEELGLKDTHFTNTSGLFHKDHYTTAYDMAIVLEAALNNPICKKVLSTYQYRTSKTPQHPEGILLSATLFEYMYGTEPEVATILGGKTGFVNEAGYCIASYGSNNETGNEYIVVTLKNSSRWPAFHGQIDLYKNFAK